MFKIYMLDFKQYLADKYNPVDIIPLYILCTVPADPMQSRQKIVKNWDNHRNKGLLQN